MITLYENFKKIPKVGDYVVIHWTIPNPTGLTEEKEFEKFLSTHIGQIILIRENETRYRVKYNWWEFSKFNNFINPSEWEITDIKFFSPNIEDCEIYIQTNKYNI